jgi:chromosome segregation protein
LSERAYTADAVQKLFNVNGERSADTPGGAISRRGLAGGLRGSAGEVRGAIEQFLRDELEYVVVESFDQARAGISLLRDEMGGRATFFVDSLNKLNLAAPEADASLPMPDGVLGRLDRLVEFREPLGPAAKFF